MYNKWIKLLWIIIEIFFLLQFIIFMISIRFYDKLFGNALGEILLTISNWSFDFMLLNIFITAILCIIAVIYIVQYIYLKKSGLSLQYVIVCFIMMLLNIYFCVGLFAFTNPYSRKAIK